MSLETRIPKEITDYREKIVFGLSGRQLISIACALALVGFTAFVLHYLLGVSLKVLEYVLILEAMPIMAVGFIRYKGFAFEDYVLVLLGHRFGPKTLVNKTDIDFLTSLYPITKRADYHEVPAKEKRRRRKRQPECLSGESKKHS